MKVYPKHVARLALAGLVLAGCSTGDSAEVSQLTIVTSSAAVDLATAMAVSEYVQDQGIAVEMHLKQIRQPTTRLLGW